MSTSLCATTANLVCCIGFEFPVYGLKMFSHQKQTVLRFNLIRTESISF